MRRIINALTLTVLLGGCDLGIRIRDAEAPPPRLVSSPVSPASAAPSGSVVASSIPLDPPKLARPHDYTPDEPIVFEGPNGLVVWLLRRPDLPLVSATFVVPFGSSSDPVGQPGAMSLLVDLQDDAAGKRTQLQLAEDIQSLGARLSSSVSVDGSSVSVFSLRSNFDSAFEILSDVVARPTLGAADFKRTKALWKNNLKRRSDDPMSVAMGAALRSMYGADSPYGHPTVGLYSKADAVTLSTLERLYRGAWRPDRATLVVAGQISQAEVRELLERHLATWRPKGDALPRPSHSKVLQSRPKVLGIDRANSSQTVVMFVGPGVSAGSDTEPALELVSSALGGSFTSRLNRNLREEKGWTYGIGSGLTSTRDEGLFLIRASIEEAFTGDAIAEIKRELDLLVKDGLTVEEIEKVKAQERRDLVEQYGGVEDAGGRLSEIARLGFPPGFDKAASRLRQAATRDQLARVAADRIRPSDLSIVVVGKRATLESELVEAGVSPIEWLGNEGEPMLASPNQKNTSTSPRSP